MKTIVTLFFGIVFSVGVFGQGKRPVVGLALSGGGAKGISHIAVLHIIDSLGIPIDYVAGTSMGAVIGGLYSVGYSPEEIHKEVTEADWGELMSDLPKREYLSIDEKNEPERYVATSVLEGFKPHVPSGFIGGQHIEAKLNQLFVGYHEETNYLELPRGFVCIAADLNNAREHVMTSGVLPNSIRASMSIPSLFDPVHMEGALLVDGGTMNNFPTDQLVKLGCDIIIGVQLHTPDLTENLSPSITEILEKTSMFINQSKLETHEEYCDLVIRPDMRNYGMTSFGAYNGIYDEGLKAARSQVDELVLIANHLKKWELEPKEAYQNYDSVYVRNITFENSKEEDIKLIADHLDLEDNTYYQIDYIEEEFRQLYGTGNFKKIHYVFKKTDRPNEFDMVVQYEDNSTNTIIGVGAKADGDFGAQALVNITRRGLFIPGSKLGLDLIVRRYPYVKASYFYDRGIKPGFGFYSQFYSASFDIYDQQNFQGEIPFDDWSNTLYIQSSYLNQASLRFGIQVDLQNFNLEKVPVLAPLDENKIRYSHFNWFTSISIDRLDRSNFATKGAKFFGEFKALHLEKSNFGDLGNTISDYDPFFIVKADYYHAFSLSNRWALIPQVRSGITFGGQSNLAYKFYTGSLGKNYLNNNHAFPGLRFMELYFGESRTLDNGNVVTSYDFASNIGTAQLNLRWNAFGKHYMSLIGAIGTASQDIEKFTQSHHFGGFGFKYSIDSGFGPLELTVHKSTERNTVFVYYNMGFWF